MRLRVYQSDKGDCLLVSGTAGGHILVDGGMRKAFQDHVRADLGKMAAKKKSRPGLRLAHRPGPHLRRAGTPGQRDGLARLRIPQESKART